jgi:predicted nucleotidyltransferase
MFTSTKKIEAMIHVDARTQKDIELAKDILLRYGCKEVYVFGSLVDGDFGNQSDIDIAVVGLAKGRFFAAYGELIEQLSRSVDLIGLDYEDDFSRRVREKKRMGRVA